MSFHELRSRSRNAQNNN
ncbi:hypothetical protein, partial [Plasmodium yoelii yoelii]